MAMNRGIHHAAWVVLVGAGLALFGTEFAAAAVPPPQEATACTPHGASGCLSVAEPSSVGALPADARRAGDVPAAAARRRSRVPTSSAPLTVAEPDGGPTPGDGAAPVSGRPVVEAPAPQPLPVVPAMPEPAPEVQPEVGPTPAAEVSPPSTAPPPAPPRPAGRLPATGGVTAGAVAGAFLSIGGICIGAGGHMRRGR